MTKTSDSSRTPRKERRTVGNAWSGGDPGVVRKSADPGQAWAIPVRVEIVSLAFRPDFGRLYTVLLEGSAEDRDNLQDTSSGI